MEKNSKIPTREELVQLRLILTKYDLSSIKLGVLHHSPLGKKKLAEAMQMSQGNFSAWSRSKGNYNSKHLDRLKNFLNTV